MSLTSRTKQTLVANAHALHPLVIIGNDGLSAGVLAEINRALYDHELIKVRIPKNGDKTEKNALAAEICNELKAECVKIIGNIAILYRPSEKKKAKA